jgi:rifampin ADP-ribosylating transferase
LGEVVDDPNLTDKRFPGNPSMSYRSREPLRVVAEVTGWNGHTQEEVRQMKDGLATLAAEGKDHIID